MNNTCIVSVAFREPYITHSKRQEGIILATENIFYVAHRNTIQVSDFQKSLYGFKPQIINTVKWEGKVIWFDPSVLPITPVKILFDALDEHPLIIRSGEEPLSNMCNAKSKAWFGVTDEDIKNEKTCAGTIYGFNFNNTKALEVFNLWKLAEEEGIFGTQDDFMAGHWADEACMALALYKCGAERFFPAEFRYLNQKEL